MHIFKYSKRKGTTFFWFFLVQIVAIFPMEHHIGQIISSQHSALHDDRTLQPQKIITIFNPKKELEIGRSWCEVVPGNIMITPDDKGVIIGMRGQVLYSSFEKADERDPELIIEHPQVRHSPMIAMAKRSDGLLIISAGNYINTEKQSVAEYILYTNGLSKMRKLDWPIQAIALDSKGDTLAIAGLHAVMVIDLLTGKYNMPVFKKKLNEENWVAGLAINPKGTAIIVIGSHSHQGMQWITVDKNENNIDVQNLKQVDNHDMIEKIYYPNLEELLYLTDSKAKIVNVYDLLQNNGEKIKTSTFAESPSHDIIIADPGEHVATAHWTNNLKIPQEIRRTIEVYRKEKDSKYIDRFVLEVPALEERYVYITPLGQQASGIGHLLSVALHGRQVVALASDGKMRWWQLPDYEKKEEPERAEKTAEEKMIELRAVARQIQETRKNRSSSAGHKRLSVNSGSPRGGANITEGVEKEKQKKVSPRMKDITKSILRGSRENNPILPLSRESSPVREEIKEKETKDIIKYSPRSMSAPQVIEAKKEEKKGIKSI